MRTVSSEAQAALAERAIILRDFIWLTVRHRETGSPFSVGYWSDLGDVSAEVVNPSTGITESRAFSAAGSLIQISPIPLVANLTVQTVTVTVSQVSDANELIRAYEAKQGRVEIFRGLFGTGGVQLAPAYPRFVGFIDRIEITTPAEGGDGGVEMSCVSHVQEMTRNNPAKRSDSYMRQRDPKDTFRQHAAAVGTWELKWGSAT